MKRFLGLSLAAACAVAFAVPAFAVDRSNVGCGLGSMLFKDQDGVLSHAFAATTNGTFGNQTFGITSGTLECAKPASFTANEKLNSFVSDNMDNLAVDISKGSGEYLTTLAVLMDTPVEARPELYRLLQSNFAAIYTSESVTSLDVLTNIERIVTAS
jgi:hypothetical protein